MQNFNENNNFQKNPEEFRQNIDPQFANTQPQQQQRGTYFCKTEFRNMLVSMSEAERNEYESTLSEEFKKSDKMPSVKKLSTLIILAILPFIVPIAINRLYAGRIVTGIIRLILPFLWIIALIIAFALGSSSVSHTEVNGVETVVRTSAYPVVSSVLFAIGGISVFVSYIWTIVDTIRSALGKQKDRYGRKIDL